MSERRFRIAFSFAGEARDFVERTAAILAKRFSEDVILYDKYHEAEFARYDLGTYLPKLYSEESDLIVPVLCPEYDSKRWTGWEWMHIYSLLTKADSHRVMPCRFKYATADGLTPAAGFIELDKKTPEEAAKLILERLATNEGREKGHYLDPGPESGGGRRPQGQQPCGRRENLHYLCDRDKQIGAVEGFFLKTKLSDLRRPQLVIIHGKETTAPRAFMDRLCEYELPRRLGALGLKGGIKRLSPPAWLTSVNPKDLAGEVREKMAAALQLEKGYEDDSKFMESFRQTGDAVLALEFYFSSREAFAGGRNYIEMLKDYWAAFPNDPNSPAAKPAAASLTSPAPGLPAGLVIVCFLIITHVKPDRRGLFAKLFSRSQPDPAEDLRAILTEFAANPGGAGSDVVPKVLDELGPVRVEHVVRWFNNNVFRIEKKRPHANEIRKEIFKDRDEMEMAEVLVALERFV